MHPQTRTIAKNATVEESIASMQAILKTIGLNIVEEACFNTPGNIWSVHIRDNDCDLLNCDGNGTSKQAALADALEKFLKYLISHQFWANYYLGDEVANNKPLHYPQEKWINSDSPDEILNQELLGFYDTTGELSARHLVDVNSSDRSRGICCLPYTNLRTQECVYFPVNLVDNLYSSNGLAVSNSLEDARDQALVEIIKNYVAFKIIAEGLSLPNVPASILDRYPELQACIKDIEKTGCYLTIQDASLGGKYPVVTATLINPKDQGVKNSFGADPVFAVAMEQAISCLLQGYELNGFGGFSAAGFDLDEIAGPDNLAAHFNNANGIVHWKFLQNQADFEFVDWSKSTTVKESITAKELSDLIHVEGNDIYFAEYQMSGVHCCRVLVPGISEIYPAEDLIWENNNAGIDIRTAILKQDKTVEEYEALLEKIDAINIDDEYSVAKLIGLPADKGSVFEELCLAELSTLLALKIQDNERIQEGCEWLLHYKQIPPQRLETYQCINTLLQLEGMVDYADTLAKLYSEETLNKALALIDGEDVYPLQSDWKMHQRLISAYRKLQNHLKV